MQYLLNQWLEQTNEQMFKADQTNPVLKQFQILCNGLRNRNEVLMAMYLACKWFHEENAFKIMLLRNNNFKELEPEWHDLFTK